MTDERDRASDPPSLGGRSGGGGDLLDLVRAAEEEATLRSGPPSERPLATPPDGETAPTSDVDGAGESAPPERISGDVVEVGDEAIDAPPSLEPFPVSDDREAAPHSGIAALRSARAVRPLAKVERATATGPRLPPALAIPLVIALAIVCLALLAR